MKIVSYYPYSSILNRYVLSAEHIVLLGITLTGVFLRLPLIFMGIWRDEAAVFFDIQGDTIAQILHNISIYEFTPPGFFLMMTPWLRWFGHNEIMTKLPVFVMGIGLIFATYRLGRMVSSKKVGLIAAATTAFSQPAVFFSQEARSFTPAALLACLCIALYCRLLRHGGQRKLDWIAFILAITGLLYFHTPGCLFAIGLGVITLVLWLKDRTGEGKFPIQKFLIAGIGIVGLYAPWLKVFLGQISGGFSYAGGAPWGRTIELSGRPIRVVYNLLYAINPGFPTKLYMFGLLIAAVLILRNRKLAKKNKTTALVSWNFELTVLSASVFLLAAIEAALSLGDRYMFCVMPIASVVLGHCLLGFSAILGDYLGTFLSKPYLKQIMLGGLVFLLFASSLVNTIGYIGVEKTSVRPLMKDLQQGVYPASPGATTYLSVPDVLGITVGYYQKFQVPPGSELGQAEFHGFPKWQNPELHQPNGYYKIWQNVDVSSTLQNIDRDRQNGKRYLGLLYSDSISHWFQPPYLAKIDSLMKELRQKYPVIQQKDYLTKKDDRYYMDEGFTFYLFDLGAPRS
jgi:4-amino-4-deoxy-L-arabinose transferase-like glycosyltransferase